MRRLNLTLPTPAENVALDEALLDWAEAENPEWEFLRLWESPRPMVVVGRSSRVEQEVNQAACRERAVPIVRRSSGGAAIVAGPGCIMYALVLSYKLRPDLRDIRRAHAFVLGRLRDSLRQCGLPVALAGTSDLVIADGRAPAGVEDDPARKAAVSVARKFSGNSLRAKRSHLVYHGTLLYNFDLPLVESCLRIPPRAPEYRDGRAHGDFLMNLPIHRQALTDAVNHAWPTVGEATDWPATRVATLVAERFGRDTWTYEFA